MPTVYKTTKDILRALKVWFMYNINTSGITVNNADCPTLEEIYKSHLPYFPLASDTLEYVRQYPREIALSKPHIQHNPYIYYATMAIDVDDSESHYIWEDWHAPPPNYAVMNPKNGHSHLLYLIRNPVDLSDGANTKPARLLSRIQTALTTKLHGDINYADLISHNPLHTHWTTFQYARKPYDLYDFGEYLDLTVSRQNKQHVFTFGVSRNCTAFDQIRHYAYDIYRSFLFKITYEQLYSMLMQQLMHSINPSFTPPLTIRELHHIAKSVATWTIKHMSPDGLRYRQQARGEASGASRRKKSQPLYDDVLSLHAEHPEYSTRKIAEILHIPQRTAAYIISKHKQKQSKIITPEEHDTSAGQILLF